MKSARARALVRMAEFLPGLLWGTAIIIAFVSSWILGALTTAIVVLLWILLTPVPADYPMSSPLDREFGPVLGNYLSKMLEGGLVAREALDAPIPRVVQEKAA